MSFLIKESKPGHSVMLLNNLFDTQRERDCTHCHFLKAMTTNAKINIVQRFVPTPYSRIC